MQKCPKCTSLFRDAVSRCEFCGYRFPADAPRSHASNNTQTPPKPESKAHHQAPPPTEPASDEAAHARVLGLRGRVTFADIKRHYRERMMEYHPDRVAALGPKLREVAEHETKKINAAYEFFTAKYASNRNS